METVEYAPGRPADVFGEHSQRTALLWHGKQPDARTAVRPLAELVAAHGVHVVVPDWNSHNDDGGRADLLRSVQFASDRVAAEVAERISAAPPARTGRSSPR